MWGVFLNAILGFIVVLTLCFAITDPKSLLSSPTGYPFIQLFYNVTNSYVGADIMVAMVIITLIFAVISEIATASRQIWSFARDNGLPFSRWLAKVRSRVGFSQSIKIALHAEKTSPPPSQC